MDANCVDRPVALVAGVTPDFGVQLVRGLVERGYEVWASEASLSEADFAPPSGRVHLFDLDLDTYLGCEQVLHTVCATRRPIVVAAVSLAGAASIRLELVDTLERFMAAWGPGRLPLVRDVRVSAKVGAFVSPVRTNRRPRPKAGHDGEEVATLVLASDETEASALTALLRDGAYESGNGIQRRSLVDVPRPRRWWRIIVQR